MYAVPSADQLCGKNETRAKEHGKSSIELMSLVTNENTTPQLVQIYVIWDNPGVVAGVVVQHASQDLSRPRLSISMSSRKLAFFELYTEGGNTACLKQGCARQSVILKRFVGES